MEEDDSSAGSHQEFAADHGNHVLCLLIIGTDRMAAEAITTSAIFRLSSCDRRMQRFWRWPIVPWAVSAERNMHDRLSRTEDSTRDPFVALFLFCSVGLLVSIGVMTIARVLGPTMFVQG